MLSARRDTRIAIADLPRTAQHPCAAIRKFSSLVVGASSSFDGAAVTNKLFPHCASLGPIKSACRGATTELLSGTPATANHNDGDTAAANELILHCVVTDNECLLSAVLHQRH